MTPILEKALLILVRRPIVLVLGIVLILLGGFASFGRMPVDLFPALDYPLINIVTRFPAGTAEDVEILITRPIENAVQGLPALRRLRSVSTAELSKVTVEFDWGTDLLSARELVLTALGQASADLPPGAQPRIENIGTSLAMISTYAVEGGDPAAMRSWLDYELAPALTSLPGVARVHVLGGERAALRVDLDPLRLRQQGLSTTDVVEAIREANVLGTAGFLDTHGRDVLISSRDEIRGLDELRHVLLRRGEDGRPVLLADVATLYPGAMPERYTVTADRRAAVVFMIEKQPRASTLAVSQEVDAALAESRPPGAAHIEKFYDQAEIIGLAYSNMRMQLIVGAMLSFILLFWALGRSRTTLAVAVSIPLCVIATFLFMNAAGLGLNLMTLGALVVTIGMISDDAVLVIENILRHAQMGKDRLRATLDGLREILSADIAGTLTTVAAFVPLVLLTGLAGRLFQPFGLTFAIVLLLSLFFSVTVIPWATARWHRPAPATRSGRATSARVFAALVRANGRLLRTLLAHRRPTIAGSILLLAGSIALLALNPVRFLPLLDEDSLLISYQLAPGTALAESDRIANELEALALGEPGVKTAFRRTGSPEASPFLEGPDEGELVLRLDRSAERSAEEIRKTLEAKLAKFDGVITTIREPTTEKFDESFSGLPALFGIVVYGSDLSQLYSAAARVETAARNVEGIAAVVNNTKIPIDSINVTVDRQAAAVRGITPAEVAAALQAAFQGTEATTSLVGGRVQRVFVRYAPDARRDLDDMRQIAVRGAGGALVPLGEVANLTEVNAYPTIGHEFGVRALTLTAEIEGDPLAVLARLDRALATLDLGPDIRIGYTGEYRELAETGKQLLWILGAAFILVFGIIAIQLGSLLDAAAVMVKLPIDFAGAALALAVTHQHLDLTVMIGFIALVGVAVNNGIVLLTFVRDLRRKGRSAVEAVQEAVAVRMRPLVLTQATSLLALIPAALGIGQGPQLLQPLGIMLLGGLTIGAIMTLNLLPVIYVATERWRRPQHASEE